MPEAGVPRRLGSRVARGRGLLRGVAAVLVMGVGVVVTSCMPDPGSASTVTVAVDGSGQYRTVQAAIDAVPADGAAHTIIVAKGTYHEVVSVPATKARLTIKGATGNPEDVVITFGNASGTAKPGGGTYGTEGSATATFKAPDLTVTGITIANSFNPAANPSITNTQAVALAAEGDRQVYTNDRIISTQDTLLAWSPSATAQTRQYFRNDIVAGTVDFLFGNATAVFDRVNLQMTDRGASSGGTNGVLTAANTDVSKKYGFLITNSTVDAAGAVDTEYLGRPWHPTPSAVAQVVIRDTVLPAAIKTAGPWTDMSGFSWKSARFAEYHNSGPGATVNANRPQLTDAQAIAYTAASYLAGTDGWNPSGATAGTSTASPTPTSASTTPTSGSTTAAGASPAGSATGDTRTVSQPVLPKICATVASTLTLTSRAATAAQESAPPDTARIQKTIDGCTQAGSASVGVRLSSAGGYADFLSGPLTLRRGVVLVLDSGVTLYASRNPADYQVSGKPTCGTVAAGLGGCTVFITVSGANAGVEGQRAADGSQGRIDGRGDTTVLGTSTTWWDLAHQAQVSGGNQQSPRLMQANNSDNFTVYDVDLLNSANFHLVYSGGTGLTVWGVRIKTPATARNTDGIDPAGATDVTIRDSYIADGDDGIAIKGNQASKNITIAGNHFYGTHGISIGSETSAGVSNVLVEDNTLTGTDPWGTASGSSNGIRIKSSPANGGTVSDIAYTNTCITATKAPIVFDTHYANGTGTGTPYFIRIIISGLVATGSPAKASSTFVGLDAAHPLGVTLDQVTLDVTTTTAAYAKITAAATDLSFSGTGVSVIKGTATASPPVCSFPPFPGL
ncbi:MULTISPECIES: pectinesterase family protein [unclassified Frankia]|uniref:pectinesterase family protein n=1 Tax=unclassified Frankia TaxID=2632575 RepID=UPI002AD3AB94|nr:MULTISPECIES: pectinesterase family protein [unclassified Frankia]